MYTNIPGKAHTLDDAECSSFQRVEWIRAWSTTLAGTAASRVTAAATFFIREAAPALLTAENSFVTGTADSSVG